MKVIDFRIWSNICSRLLYCEFVGFEVLSDVHAQCFLIRICFGVRIIGATDVDKHLCEQITKILWIWNVVVNSMQREGAVRQSSKVVSWPNYVLVALLGVALQSYSVAPLGVARPKGAATLPSEKIQSLLGLGTQWRDSGHLSCHCCWRDKPTLSAQRLFWHWPIGPGGQPVFRVYKIHFNKFVKLISICRKI